MPYGGEIPTIAQAVSDIIKHRPFIEEGLVKGIINYAYLADMLKPDVEAIVGKETNRYAIVMAIRRLSDVLAKSFIGKPNEMFKHADINMTSGIFEMTVRKDARALKNVAKLYELVDFSKGDFLTITHGLYEMTIISNAKYKKEIAAMFSKHEIISIVGGLSSLIVRIQPDAADKVGVLYVLTKALSWENINIVEVVSTLTEEIFIIREADAAQGFAALNAAIKSF
jgi:hypothetical protein